MRKNLPYKSFLLLLLALLLLAACGDQEPEEVGEVVIGETPATADSPIETQVPPTAIPPTPSPDPSPTPQPAALVNGQPILMEAYQRELARYELAQAELGIDPDQEEVNPQAVVLNALIERELMQQAAAVQGVAVTAEFVEQRIVELRQAADENGSFDEWLAANLYTEEEFKEALAAELTVEQMIAVITADVPKAMEHVRVLYIQIDDEGQAQFVLGQLHEGSDFADLAKRYSLDQATAPYGGDLGYFTRGSLLVPEIEEAAFDLDLEETSDIIAVTDPESGATTYYIVKLMEQDPDRMLGADLRHRLLQEAFDSWLEDLVNGATVINFLENQS